MENMEEVIVLRVVILVDFPIIVITILTTRAIVT